MKKRRKEEEATTEGRELGPPSADAGKARREEGTEGKGKTYPKGEMSESEHSLHCFAAAAAAVTVVHSCRSFFLFGSVSARVSESADLAFVYLSGVPYLY